MASRFPVVDFAPFVDVNSSDSDRAKTASDLTAACHRYGFVTITGHGLPAELLEKAFTMLHQLFDLPQEAKLKAPHPDGPVPHRGYSAPGLEKVYTKEQIHQDPATIRKISDFKVSWNLSFVSLCCPFLLAFGSNHLLALTRAWKRPVEALLATEFC